MPRGVKTSIEDLINKKEELISSLQTRLKSEKVELEELYKEKRDKDLSSIYSIIDETGISTEEAVKAINKYISEKSKN